MVYATARFLFLPIFITKFKEVNGLENLPEKGPYIIATNHIDFMDGFFVAFAFYLKKKHTVYFLSKTKNYWWSKATLPINPYNKEESIKDAVGYLKEGKIICNFIEGKRNTKKHLLEGRTGTVRMALMAQVPIIPVGITCPITFSYSKSVVNLLIKNHQAIINIGQPITFEEHYNQGVTRSLLVKLTREVMRKISPLCGKAYSF